MNGDMEIYPAVIVHGMNDAVAALSEGSPRTLVSAPGAALFAGCGWWRALVEAARAIHPDVSCMDILDCGDGTGQALAALRIGVTRLVLWPDAPGRDAGVAIAEAMGGFVLASAPPAATVRANHRTASATHGGSAETGPTGSGDKRRPPG